MTGKVMLHPRSIRFWVHVRHGLKRYPFLGQPELESSGVRAHAGADSGRAIHPRDRRLVADGAVWPEDSRLSCPAQREEESLSFSLRRRWFSFCADII